VSGKASTPTHQFKEEAQRMDGSSMVVSLVRRKFIEPPFQEKEVRKEMDDRFT
jgi:hypothetical protein